MHLQRKKETKKKVKGSTNISQSLQNKGQTHPHQICIFKLLLYLTGILLFTEQNSSRYDV